MSRVAINGLGRIGRAALKIILDTPGLELIAVNDLVPVENLAYLLRYDTVYGRYTKTVEVQAGKLEIDGKSYEVFSEKDPAKLPWKSSSIDIVFECTGIFTKMEDLKKHIQAGAKNVILSAPTKSEDVPTIVHRVNTVNHKEAPVISCASCTTNCITPVVEIIGRRIGIDKAMMTTIHAYTSTQGIVDGPAGKYRRGRAAAANFIPTSTGAAVATAKALPQIKGKFDGIAIRGPVPCGSVADITFLTSRETSVDEVNSILSEESSSKKYKGVIRATGDEIVSSDILQDPHASIIDLTMTQVVDGNLLKVLAWYDNEWGYANQMIREALTV